MLSRRVVRKGRPGAAERRFRTALGVATLLHALIAVLAYREGGRHVDLAPPPTNVEVDLVLPPPKEPPPESPRNAPAEPAPRERPPVPPERRVPRAEPPAEPQQAPDSAAPEVLAEDSDSSVPEAAPPGEPDPKANPGRPRLSLDALGIGAVNPFLDAGPPSDGRKPKVSAEAVQARLDHALTEDIARADQGRGLGPEGPLIASLEKETRKSATSPSSSALFRLSTDGSGTLVGIQVISATSDATLWKELGDRVLLEYARKKLRGSHGARGLTFEIRITSRVTLPSGSQSAVGVTAPSLDQPLPSLKGDFADFGSRPARRVNARLERIWAN